MRWAVLRLVVLAALLVVTGSPTLVRAQEAGPADLDEGAAPATLTVVAIDEFGGALGGACFVLAGPLTTSEVCPATPATSRRRCRREPTP